NLKDRLGEMSDEEKLELLASDGMLVKRPLAVSGDTVTVGFKEADYRDIWVS
ncbi:arsenate reductase, partial [Staphylococcus pseudintermedius]